MKKTILLSALTLVFMACGNSTQKKAEETPKNITATQGSASLKIGVINTDSILEKYTFAIEARQRMTKKAEDARLSLGSKAKQLQQEMATFQNKIDNSAFLSRERAEQEAKRLQKKQEDVQLHGQTLESEFMQEQERLSIQLKDSINVAIKAINKEKCFSLIISTNSMSENVLYSEDNLNITKEVLNFLNSRIKK